VDEIIKYKKNVAQLDNLLEKIEFLENSAK